MVVDASALMAILLGEPEKSQFTAAIDADAVLLMSPINLLEAHMLMRSRKRDEGVRLLDDFVAEASIEIAPVDARQTEIALAAFDRFGKGRHPAGLNLADCFAYALSKTSGEPLLFKGGDFALTDVLVAG